MAQELGILIRTWLDSSNSAITSLNEQIKKLANHPGLAKLKLSVDLDTKTLDNLQKQVQDMQNYLERRGSKGLKIIDIEDVKSQGKELFKTLDDVVDRFKHLGTVTFPTKEIDPATNELKSFVLQLEKADKTIEKIRFGLTNVADGTNIDKYFIADKVTQIDKTAELREKVLQEELNIRQKLIKQEEQENLKQIKYAQEYEQWWLKALKERELKEDKIRIKQQEQNEKLKEQLELFKRQQRLQVQVAKERYDGLVTADGTKLSEMFDEHLKKVNALTVETPKLQKEMDNLAMGFREVEANAKTARNALDIANKSAISLGNSLKTALIKFPIWVATASIIYTPIRAIRDMTQTVIELDSQLTVLKRVMDQDTNFEHMMQGAIQISKELGQVLTDVNVAMTGFARQGFSEDQVLALTRTATLMQNISDLSSEDAMSTLTAAMTIFNIEASKSIEIIDKLNEIDNNFAIDTANLSYAMNKSAATAKTFGVSMEELLGHITAIGVVTRETGQVVGNALKSIYSRLTTMPASINALARIGISVKDANDEMKSASVIIDELAQKWNSLTAETQQNIAVTLAGRYQLSRFLALMNNYQMAIDATSMALNSEGSALRENERYMESLEAKIKLMQSAWQELSYTMGNAVISDTIITLTSVLTWLARGIADVMDRAGALPVVFAGISGAVFLASKAFQAILTNMVKSTAAMFGFKTATDATTQSVKLFNLSLNSLKTSFKSLLASTGVGIAFFALGYALEWVIGLFGKANKEVEDYTQTTEKLVSTTKELTQLQELSSEYEQLAKKVNLTTNEKIRLANIETTLKDRYDLAITSIENQREAYESNNKVIQQRIQLLQKEREELNKVAIAEFQKDETKTIDEISSYTAIREQLVRDRDAAQYVLDNLENYKQGSYIYNETLNKGLIIDKNKFQEQKETLAQWVSDINTKIKDADAQIEESIKKRTNAFIALFDLYNSEMEASGVEVKKTTKLLSEALASALVSTGSTKTIEEAKKEYAQLFEVFQNADIRSIDDAINLFDSLPEGVNLTKKEIAALSVELARMNFSPLNEELEGMAEEFKTLDELYKEATNELKDLNKAIEEVSNGQSLNAEMVADLILKYPELLGKIEKTTEGYRIEKSVLEELRNAQIDLKIEAIKQQEGMTNEIIAQLSKRMEAYGIELSTIQTLADAQNAVKKKIDDTIKNAGADAARYVAMALKEDSKVLYQYASLMERLNILREGLKTVGTSSSSKSTSSKSSSPTPSYTDPIDAIIRQINQAAEARKEAIKELNEDLSFAKSQDNYFTALEKTAQLMNEHTLVVRDLTEANKKLHEEANKVRQEYSQFDTSNWFTADGEATVEYVNQFNNASKEQQELMGKVFNKISKLKKAYMDNAEAIRTYSREIRSLNIDLNELTEKVADDVVNAYKEALKKQRDLIVSSIKSQMDAEDKRHKQVMDNLDEEYRKFEETINGILRLLDDQWDEEDFNKELTKKQKEAQELQRQIDILALDDSIEANAKREELQKQLDEKLLEIEEFKTKRSRELQKKSLQDTLDNYKKDIDAKKKAEEQNYESTKESLEKQLQDQEWYYDEILNNEREFNRIRTDIINGHVDEIQNKLTMFITEFKKTNEQAAKDIGQSYQEILNIIDRVNTAKGSLSGINLSSPLSSSDANLAKIQAWYEYLGNKQKAEEEFRKYGTWNMALHERNNQLRQQWGFPDGSYDALKNLPIYHDGGIVGGKGSAIAKVINKIFNVKPNEEIAKLIKGEVVINPMKLQSLIPSIPPIRKGVSTEPVVVQIDTLMHVDKIDKDVNIDTLVDRTIDRLNYKFKGLGFVMK